MYLWFATDLSESLAAARREAERVTDELGLNNAALALPVHVSLRIALAVADEESENVCVFVERYFEETEPFDIIPDSVGQNGNIVWCRLRENRQLSEIHRYLVDELKNRFDVGSHPFDDSFLYHATLFFGDGEAEASAAFERLKNLELPSTLRVSRFLIGGSETGRPGEYRVFREVEAAK